MSEEAGVHVLINGKPPTFKGGYLDEFIRFAKTPHADRLVFGSLDVEDEGTTKLLPEVEDVHNPKRDEYLWGKILEYRMVEPFKFLPCKDGGHPTHFADGRPWKPLKDDLREMLRKAKVALLVYTPG